VSVKLKRRKIANAQEKTFMINLISSTEFCKNILPLITTKLLKTNEAKLAFKWISLYFDKYLEAPRSNLKVLFEDATVNEKKETVELIAKYLEGLSNDYIESPDVNIAFEITQE
jgi:hypothetical protein